MTDQQKIALVTGANKGIGKHIARQLAQAGLLVFVGSRDRARGRVAVDELAAEGLSVRLLPLDVTDPVSVMAAAEQLDQDPGHLDVLVNNAGITSGLEPASQVSVNDIRRTYETNVFGVVAVTNALLPLLRRSPAPRIVNVSSGLGSLSIMSDPTFAFADLNNAAYQSSKTALNALTVLYAKDLHSAGIKVNAVCPGYRATDLNRGLPNPGAGDPADGATIAVQLALIGDDGPSGEFFSDTGTRYPW
jgi:NAD(P)-dependent dehydrogenase (short-subunit alcohol dehydrogenase family)